MDLKITVREYLAALYSSGLSQASLENLECVKCKTAENVEMHHVRKLSSLNPKLSELDRRVFLTPDSRWHNRSKIDIQGQRNIRTNRNGRSAEHVSFDGCANLLRKSIDGRQMEGMPNLAQFLPDLPNGSF